MKKTVRIVAICLAGVGLASVAGSRTSSARAETPIYAVRPAPSATRCNGSFAGDWLTTYGPVSIRVESGKVSATYVNYNGRLSGSLDGKVIEADYQDRSGKGGVRLVLSRDGRRFFGSWVSSTGASGIWNGQCDANGQAAAIREATERAAICAGGLAGTWKTDYGPVTFAVTGTRATATYPTWAGRLEGKVVGRVFEGTYSDSSGKGRVRFEIARDGRSLRGSWASTQGGGGAWNGSCEAPSRT
ncbi:MAG: hypothetical protein HYY84_01355 [Deltaproteobacteria bacterium]|nr:hypothetical protein [Deltaproteobacteria bacterium]